MELLANIGLAQASEFASAKTPDFASTKICRCCKKEKPLSDFGAYRRQKDGHHYYCIECMRAKGDVRKAMPEVKEQDRMRSKKRYHSMKQQGGSDFDTLREVKRLTSLSYAHSELGRTSHIAACSKRRSLRYGKSDKNDLTAEQWRKILSAYGRCAYCGATHVKLTMDHIIPLGKGGDHTASNIVPACKPCNDKKALSAIQPSMRIPLSQIF